MAKSIAFRPGEHLAGALRRSPGQSLPPDAPKGAGVTSAIIRTSLMRYDYLLRIAAECSWQFFDAKDCRILVDAVAGIDTSDPDYVWDRLIDVLRGPDVLFRYGVQGLAADPLLVFAIVDCCERWNREHPGEAPTPEELFR